MKRFHVHISVADLGESIRFYSKLFGGEPTVTKTDYAKWMLEDPRVNFAISTHHQPAGLNHLGLQVDSDEELRGMQAQLRAADAQLVQENEQPCCYARSDKYWVTDPTGIAWETFHTLAAIPVYGEDTPVFDHGTAVAPNGAAVLIGSAAAIGAAAAVTKAACCVPATNSSSRVEQSSCCAPNASTT